MKIRSTTVQVTDNRPISFNAVLAAVASTNVHSEMKKKKTIIFKVGCGGFIINN